MFDFFSLSWSTHFQRVIIFDQTPSLSYWLIPHNADLSHASITSFCWVGCLGFIFFSFFNCKFFCTIAFPLIISLSFPLALPTRFLLSSSSISVSSFVADVLRHFHTSRPYPLTVYFIFRPLQVYFRYFLLSIVSYGSLFWALCFLIALFFVLVTLTSVSITRYSTIVIDVCRAIPGIIVLFYAFFQELFASNCSTPASFEAYG